MPGLEKGTDGSLRAPLVMVNQETGKIVPLVTHYFDCEVLLTDGERDERADRGSFYKDVTPVMAITGTFRNQDADPEEDAEIKALKMEPFPMRAAVGPTCIEESMNHLKDHAIEAARRRAIILRAYESHHLSPLEEASFQAAKNCDNCHVEFSTDDAKKIKTRHHNHHNSKLIGFYCFSCNAKIKSRNQTTCLIFNLNFDIHFILLKLLELHELGEKPFFYQLKILPNNAERLLSMTVYLFCPHCDVKEANGKIKRKKKGQPSGADGRTPWACPEPYRHCRIDFHCSMKLYPGFSLRRLIDAYA